MNKFNFLKKLVKTPSPSGFEHNAVNVWKDYIEKYADYVHIDDIQGNAYAVLEGKTKIDIDERSIIELPSIMLIAHIDEVGLMVNHIDQDGFISLSQVGGLDNIVLPGQRIVFENGTRGVISREAIHMLTRDEEDEVPKIYDLIVDIGASTLQEAYEKVSIGDVATIDVGLEKLNHDKLIGRAFDDKAGVWIISQVFKRLSKIREEREMFPTVYCVISTNEENGAYGATTITNQLNPDYAIIVDATHALDTPGVDNCKHGDTVLDGGPAISFGSLINNSVSRELVEVAEDIEMEIQREAAPKWTGTDGDVVAISKNGVKTGLVSFPLRYMHTPVEVVSYKNLKQCVKLISKFIKRI